MSTIHTHTYSHGLESARLFTRRLTLDDCAVWADFFRDGEVTQFLPRFHNGSPEACAEYWIRRQMNRYENQEFGLQALIDKTSGAFVGQCGLLLQAVEGQAEVEVGYHIFKHYWGRGYAPEAAKLFIHHAFEQDISRSVISIIDVNNLRSQRVAEKNGLKQEQRSNWSDLDVFIYRIKQ